jgi:hypothetical protein
VKPVFLYEINIKIWGKYKFIFEQDKHNMHAFSFLFFQIHSNTSGTKNGKNMCATNSCIHKNGKICLIVVILLIGYPI